MTLLLITHILIALGSLGYALYALFKPSKKSLTVCYALLAATVASGSWLMLLSPAKLTQTCQTGLVYLGLMLFGILAIRHRLGQQTKTQ